MIDLDYTILPGNFPQLSNVKVYVASHGLKCQPLLFWVCTRKYKSVICHVIN